MGGGRHELCLLDVDSDGHGDGESPLQCIAIRDTAAIQTQHSFEVVMICLQRPILVKTKYFHFGDDLMNLS